MECSLHSGGGVVVSKIRKNSNWIVLALIVIIIYKGVENYHWIFENINLLVSILIPFFWGFAIAYILNPLMVKLETKLKMKRFFSMTICYLIFFGVIALFIIIVTPIIMKNLFDIIEKLPDYIQGLQIWFNETLLRLSLVERLNLQEYIQSNIAEISTMLLEFMNLTINGLLVRVIGITSGLLKFIVGIIVSIYILIEKEKFGVAMNKFILAMSGEKRYDKVMNFFSLCNQVFSNFIIGKSIDSFIIGLICFAGMKLLGAPYATLLSVIVGVTNMIPYFGPVIGAIPAILITLFISPIKALWVAIFILVLQQVDGNIIGPKILGDKVGISPFYIILSILIGGGFFGMLGMLFAVPTFKIVSILLGRYLDARIEKQRALDIVSGE